MNDALDSQDFYEVCQQYRHAPMGGDEFRALKEWLRANAVIGATPVNPTYKDEV